MGVDRRTGELYDSGWSAAFQIDAAGAPGNSGCPVFTLDGKWGILVGGFTPVHVIVMPVDLVLDDIEEINNMFIQGKYQVEELLDDRFDEMYSWYGGKRNDYRLDEVYCGYSEHKEAIEELCGIEELEKTITQLILMVQNLRQSATLAEYLNGN